MNFLCLLWPFGFALASASFHKTSFNSLEAAGEYKFALSPGQIQGKVIAVADVNGDGLHDLIVSWKGNLHFHLGISKQQTFHASPISIPIQGKVLAVVYANFQSIRIQDQQTPNLMITTSSNEEEEGIFRTQFFHLQTNTKKQLKSAQKILQQDLISKSLLLLGNFFDDDESHEEEEISSINGFLGMNSSLNELVIWFFQAGNFKEFPFPSSTCKLPPFHQSQFVDVNCDKSPEIVLHCLGGGEEGEEKREYLEFWSAKNFKGKFPFSPSSSNSRFPLPLGTKTFKIVDFFGNGITQLVTGNEKGEIQVFSNNIQYCNSSTPNKESNCAILRSFDEIAIIGTVEMGFSLDSPQVSFQFPSTSSSSAAAIRQIQFADFNLDGELELAVVLSDGTFRLLIQQETAGSNLKEHESKKLVILEHSSLEKAYKEREIEALTFFLSSDSNPFLNVLLVKRDSLESFSSVILHNFSSFDSFFIHLYPLDVSFHRHGQFAPSCIGNVVYFAVHEGRSFRVQSFSMCSASTDSLSCLPSLTFGLGRMNNFLPYLSVFRRRASGGKICKRSWNSIIPNSKLRAFVGDASNEERWHLQIYFEKSVYFWTVLISVASVMFVFGGLSVGFKWREVAADKLEKRRNLSRMNFNAL